MRRVKNAVISAAIVIATSLGGWISAAPAHAYGGDGQLDVYQLGISFNCNNRTLCAGELGGFWGWAELDHDPVTGSNTGDAEFAGCSHGEFNGAAHISEEITNWYTAQGSAGPNTLYITGVDTVSFRGTIEVDPFSDEDVGMPLAAGHYSARTLFGITAPPGTNFEVQVAFKPAH
jgi:hypothetical protein